MPSASSAVTRIPNECAAPSAGSDAYERVPPAAEDRPTDETMPLKRNVTALFAFNEICCVSIEIASWCALGGIAPFTGAVSNVASTKS